MQCSYSPVIYSDKILLNREETLQILKSKCKTIKIAGILYSFSDYNRLAPEGNSSQILFKKVKFVYIQKDNIMRL